jgi:hypothetical protein
MLEGVLGFEYCLRAKRKWLLGALVIKYIENICI